MAPATASAVRPILRALGAVVRAIAAHGRGIVANILQIKCTGAPSAHGAWVHIVPLSAHGALEPAVMAYRLIVFDFDGPLADSERCITASMRAALAECGLAADWTRLRSHIGLPLDRTI